MKTNNVLLCKYAKLHFCYTTLAFFFLIHVILKMKSILKAIFIAKQTWVRVTQPTLHQPQCRPRLAPSGSAPATLLLPEHNGTHVSQCPNQRPWHSLVPLPPHPPWPSLPNNPFSGLSGTNFHVAGRLQAVHPGLNPPKQWGNGCRPAPTLRFAHCSSGCDRAGSSSSGELLLLCIAPSLFLDSPYLGSKAQF